MTARTQTGFLFDVVDAPHEVDLRTDAERESHFNALMAKLREFDGIGIRLCIEVAGPNWLETLKARGVAVIIDTTGLVRVEN